MILTASRYTTSQINQYLAALRGSYRMKTRIDVMTNSRVHRSTLPGVIVDGQVDVKRWRLDPTQPANKPDEKGVVEDQQIGLSRMVKNLTIYDPKGTIAFDSDAPSDGALYLDRTIQIIVSISCPFGWFDVPVFTGPVTGFDRDSTFVELEAESNEHFGLGQAFRSRTLRGSAVQVFKTLMALTGEVSSYWDIPTAGDVRLPKPVVLGPDSQFWPKGFQIMASRGRHAFYDGAGVLRTPGDSNVVQAVFDAGDRGLLLEDPRRGHGTANMRNAWRVETSDANGKTVEAQVPVSWDHPLSPAKLGRNGQPYFRMTTENLPDLRTKAAATKRCTQQLKYAASELELPLRVRPVFHLEPIGAVTVKPDDWSVTIPVEEFSLPITPGREMNVGARKRIPNPNFKKIRG